MKVDNKTIALSALLMSAATVAQADAKKAPTAAEEHVMCYGVNACKGQGACHGKVDTCSGKNNCSTELKCGGMNSCKGKGVIRMTKKECADKKGTPAT